MLHLIAYDITETKRLRRVAKLCEDYGVRVERSVFECDLPDDTMSEFWGRLCDIVNAGEDYVLDYRIDAIDRKHIRRIGRMDDTLSADDIIVL